MAVHFILLPLTKLCIAPAKCVTRGILTYHFVPLLLNFLEKGIFVVFLPDLPGKIEFLMYSGFFLHT